MQFFLLGSNFICEIMRLNVNLVIQSEKIIFIVREIYYKTLKILMRKKIPSQVLREDIADVRVIRYFPSGLVLYAQDLVICL